MLFQHLFVASDHAGFDLKQDLFSFCEEREISFQDLGPQDKTATDYPDYADLVVHHVRQTPESAGLLICGTGIGMSIAANRYPGIRGALCCNAEMSSLARRHNNANVLCLGARFIKPTEARSCLKTFLTTPFEEGRHQRRLDKIEQGSQR